MGHTMDTDERLQTSEASKKANKEKRDSLPPYQLYNNKSIDSLDMKQYHFLKYGTLPNSPQESTFISTQHTSLNSMSFDVIDEQEPSSIAIELPKDSESLILKTMQCTDCGLSKQGKVYESDGCFYCLECWAEYETQPNDEF